MKRHSENIVPVLAALLTVAITVSGEAQQKDAVQSLPDGMPEALR